jgi:hypothetical protein
VAPVPQLAGVVSPQCGRGALSRQRPPGGAGERGAEPEGGARGRRQGGCVPPEAEEVTPEAACPQGLARLAPRRRGEAGCGAGGASEGVRRPLRGGPRGAAGGGPLLSLLRGAERLLLSSPTKGAKILFVVTDVRAPIIVADVWVCPLSLPMLGPALSVAGVGPPPADLGPGPPHRPPCTGCPSDPSPEDHPAVPDRTTNRPVPLLTADSPSPDIPDAVRHRPLRGLGFPHAKKFATAPITVSATWLKRAARLRGFGGGRLSRPPPAPVPCAVLVAKLL